MASFFFDLPEYDLALNRFTYTAIHELMKRKNKILDSIRTEYTDSIPNSQITLPSGEVVPGQQISVQMRFQINLVDAINGDTDNLTASIDDASEQALKSIMPQFYAYVGRTSEATGTSTDAKGQPISRALILQSLRKVEIDFDENGNPKIQAAILSLFGWPPNPLLSITNDTSDQLILVMHPKMAEQLYKLPLPKEEETREFSDFIEQKREEYNARRRSRQLS